MTYDPDNNTVRVAGYGDVPENLGVKTYWKNFNPRTGISWRVNEVERRARRLRRERVALAELLWSGLPDQTDPAVDGADQLHGSRRAGDRHAGACRSLPIPDSGILDATGLRGESAGRRAARPSRGAAALVERRPISESLPGGFTAEVAYVGNRGRDNPQSIDLNAGLHARSR